ncbi:MAG: hypothetical protein ABIJ09_15605 [Pseudomonadota bacterium]
MTPASGDAPLSLTKPVLLDVHLNRCFEAPGIPDGATGRGTAGLARIGIYCMGTPGEAR